MIICFDLETTWLDKMNDKIIEIAMIKFDENTFEVIDTYTSFVNPKIEIPEIITNITNITDIDVESAPFIEDLRQELLDFIWNNPLLWHNVKFDIDFFVNNGINISQNLKIDTFFLANFLTYNNSSLNLEMLCNHYNIWFKWAHRAINDVKATIALFEKQLADFENIDQYKKNLVFYILNHSTDNNVFFIKDLLFKNQNIDIDDLLFEKDILEKVWRFCEDEKSYISTSLDDSDFTPYFSKWEWYEVRENQLKMTNKVYESFRWLEKSVIEAPTWLWKSYAYLIPSIIHSLKTGEKVYVSTKTKNLQDQLYDKDLKFLLNSLDLEFSYTKLKWKRNYLSVKSYFDHIFLWNFSYSEVCFYLKMTLWICETKYWELDEITLYPDEYSIIKYLNSESNKLITEKNDYKEYEFLYKARKKLDKSNIIVINHSLLFSDISSENPVLPKMKNLVIDEAHNIEDSVTESLKERYSLKSFIENLSSIEKILKLKNQKTSNFLILKDSLINRLSILDDYWFSYLEKKVKWNQNYKITLLKEDFFNDIDFTDTIKKIKLDIVDIVDILKIIDNYDFSKEASFLDYISKSIDVIFDKSNWNYFIKILTYSDNGWFSFDYTLLNPWEYLSKNLWDKLNSCILTSATLSIWWKFDYIDKLLSLSDFTHVSYESDFDYKKQSTLFIPTDLWSIKNNSDSISEFLKSFFIIARWNILTLLTSFSSIRNIYTHCNIDLKKEWINLYAQSIWWSKTKLLSFFLDNPDNSILLWTDSFWEWVNIPWDDLKYLVIHKFPFQVPTDPIFQARSVFFKDAFNEYSVPKAIIKLKQWFWRLIRTKTDTWIVVLLDDRINTKWWELFYKSFPDEINIKKWTKKQFLEILERF